MEHGIIRDYTLFRRIRASGKSSVRHECVVPHDINKEVFKSTTF